MIAELAVIHLLRQVQALAGRIYPDRINQGEPLPAVTFTRIATEVVHKLDGPCGLDHNLFTIEVHSFDRLESIQLSRAIRTVLAGFRGDAGGVIVTSLSISGGERCTYEGPNDASDKVVFIASQDYQVSTCEPVE